MAKKPFHLGINMAGAISAGAYTAGVFDFLVEALDQWQIAKEAADKAWKEKRTPPNVPTHEVVIDVLSGASAGGMCAALGAISLFDRPGACESRLHQAWVKEIDIRRLLGTNDLKEDAPVLSLFDSSALDDIATRVLAPGGVPIRPSYVSENLTVLLTLTNLRGVPYSVDFSNEGTFAERTTLHADRIQFTIATEAVRSKPDSYVVRLDGNRKNMQMLKEAALATGAFPVAFAGRSLLRRKAEYQKLESVPATTSSRNMRATPARAREVGIHPSWNCKKVPRSFPTVNIDGGATNNSPFELAAHLLDQVAPVEKIDPKHPEDTDRAVVTVAPFPGNDGFDCAYDSEKERGLDKLIPRIVTTLLDQARFYGEELSLLRDSKVFSRFVIAPKHNKSDGVTQALQCGSLGRFGGFLSECFRVRDYELGRFNCRKFLKKHFVLPAENKLIWAGIARNDAELIRKFHAPEPKMRRFSAISTKAWMPVIPLCGSARKRVGYPAPGKISKSASTSLASAAASFS